MIMPEQLAKSGSEHGHQTALFAWAAMASQYVPELHLMFAIPNGGLRGKATASRLKAEGVKAGVFDIFLPVARRKYHGVFIEMKRGRNLLTPAQEEFCEAVRDQGYLYCVAYSWQSAAKNLIWYFENEFYVDSFTKSDIYKMVYDDHSGVNKRG